MKWISSTPNNFQLPLLYEFLIAVFWIIFPDFIIYNFHLCIAWSAAVEQG